MAQKINPIAVRLKNNRNSDSYWFSDYYYATLLYQDYNFRNYLNNIKRPTSAKPHLGLKTGRCVIHHYPKRSIIHLFLQKESSLLASRLASQKAQKRLRSLYSYQNCIPFIDTPQKMFTDKITHKLNNNHKSATKQPRYYKQVDRFGYYFDAINPNKETMRSAQDINLPNNRRLLALQKHNTKYHFLKLRNKGSEAVKGISLFKKSNWTTLASNATSVCEPRILCSLELNNLAMHYFLKKKTNSFAPSFKTARSLMLLWRPQRLSVSQGAKHQLQKQLNLLKSQHYYLYNIQNIMRDQTNTMVSIAPIKVPSVYQSALLVSQEISYKLEGMKSFRQICKVIFQQIAICDYIKGIRVVCSGRLNGAEIAKTECKKYGETSLHVFSDQIDYAFTKASTPYGILGVKVWICYL